MHKHTALYLTVLCLFFFFSCGVKEPDKAVSVKAPASPKAEECYACHKDKDLLPQGHVATGEMTKKDCESCHTGGLSSLRGKISLGHKHKLEGLTCKECHEGPGIATAMDSSVCQGCHNDQQALFDAGKGLSINPHYSPHEGKISDCNKCHHQHKSSENYCAGCHGIESRVP